MEGQQEVYRKRQNPELDNKFELFKRANLFAGDAVDNALSQKEVDRLIKIWCKYRRAPWKLKVGEVSTLVQFTEKIFAWRRNRRRELKRVWAKEARRKLRVQANGGNVNAVRKLKSVKKADKIKSSNYRKMKRKVRNNTKQRKNKLKSIKKADKIKSSNYRKMERKVRNNTKQSECK